MRPYLFILFLLPCLAVSAEITPPDDPIYATIPDEEYLQEVGSQIVTDQPVVSIAAHDGQVFAIVGTSLQRVVDDVLRPVDVQPAQWQRLYAVGNAVWGVTADGVYRLTDADAGKPQAVRVFEAPMVDLCLHNGAVHGATRDDVYRFDGERFVNIKPDSGWLTTNTTMIMEDGTQILADPIRIGPISGLASYAGTLYLLSPRGPKLLDGDVFVESPVDWGEMPSKRVRDIYARGSQLWMATDRGVAVLRGAALTTLDGTAGLPQIDTRCLASGFNRDLWIGTSRGVIRRTGDDYHYFRGRLWLPGDDVAQIAVDEQTVYVATNRGIGILRYEPFTLRKKAAYFERDLKARGHQRLGFIHKLYWSTPENDWVREISDNDGGHTAHYLAAMCFKYAVTGDESARQEAIDAMEAMLWLETITGSEGFFARAIWAEGYDPGHRSERGSGGLPADWQRAEEDPWFWKGDTSSDEVNSHFYAASLFHDLVAKGEQKQRAAEHLARISRHIMDHGWTLQDVDGEPTRWGRWDPEYLLRPYGFEAVGLNGMEAQTYMWTALKLTGNQRFREGLEQLLAWRYHEYTVREKLTFPPESVVTWDDELAFRCFLPLLSYCDDPVLRSIYLRALERHWEVLRMQKIPYFNFLYGGVTGNDCEAAEAAEHLRAWSLDTTSHTFINSDRADLEPEPGYTPYAGGSRAVSPRNQASMWGSRSAIAYDGGGGGRVITPAVGWLEDYWMGRYYGQIAAPADEDLASSLSDDYEPPAGAAPYQGPPRPEGLLP